MDKWISYTATSSAALKEIPNMKNDEYDPFVTLHFSPTPKENTNNRIGRRRFI